MKRKTAVLLLVLPAIALLIYWIADGTPIWTQTEVAVVVEDELFGTESIEWQDGFRPGLDAIGPTALVLLIGAFWISRRSKRRTDQEETEGTASVQGSSS